MFLVQNTEKSEKRIGNLHFYLQLYKGNTKNYYLKDFLIQ